MSTGGSFDLNSWSSITEFFCDSPLPSALFVTPLLLVLALRLLIRATSNRLSKSASSLLPPFFFLSLTPLFYVAIEVFGLSFAALNSSGWMFPSSEDPTDPTNSPAAVFFPSYGLSNISWTALLSTLPVQISCAVFSLMHAPINIPSMSISSGVDVDMNRELLTHAKANLLAFLALQPPNYMCYSNSIVYFRSGGRGELSSLAVVAATFGLFFFGSDIVTFIPRLMAATLLVHVGLDLFIEGVRDSWYAGFDTLEYTSIWIIVLTMSGFGMTTGLIVGILCAAVTFAVNAGPAHLDPIRGAMPATTLMSSRWRGLKARRILDEVKGRRRILCVQLQGHIYFANLDQFTEGVKKALQQQLREDEGGPPFRFVILDFTLVLGLDTSAALAVVKLAASLLSRHGVRRVAFVTGKEDGFPTSLDLMNQLKKREFCTVHWSLDSALAFFEDVIIKIAEPGLEKDSWGGFMDEGREVEKKKEERGGGELQETAIVKRMLQVHCPAANPKIVDALFGMLTRRELSPGQVLWRQGDLGDRMVLLFSGKMTSALEEEAGTVEAVLLGHFIGELALIMGEEGRRLTSVTVDSDGDGCVVFEIDKESWERCKEQTPEVSIHVMTMACRYLQHRVQHVSNRFIETRCVPI